MRTLRDFQAQKINKLMMSMLKGGTYQDAACDSGQTLYTCTVTSYGSSYEGYMCATSQLEAETVAHRDLASGAMAMGDEEGAVEIWYESEVTC
ncbi:hypothetical protein M2451_004136 [Dysgonomonas sp. PFB1-18]|uniref:hypothetical protein n=1 Tax=unclassified Dysgonomonas TaxID=2630389 RepID=UPI002474B64F|nr:MULTISPECIES: hypothetical protein [unclassified Dysgonomonas]MDH6311197.1 hypothetical protein [Dysgonomonas sp. PF1-14]MDH6341081.1 hypothetical protein [Dysgonomonas sp. PF1-16]MDH6382785.1 hypothetical protein [Dysgonomonas sp. PFB1-18]MDH6400069.1 hypothetical protein [Dysgonomonas sp. PF1-23]